MILSTALAATADDANVASLAALGTTGLFEGDLLTWASDLKPSPTMLEK